MRIRIAVAHHAARSISDDRVAHHHHGAERLIAACDGVAFHARGFRDEQLRRRGVACGARPDSLEECGDAAQSRERKMAAIEIFSVTTSHEVTPTFSITHSITSLARESHPRETRMRSRLDITILPAWKD